ncbi:hypothetical protein [Candidatus Walczuchella endosymbiont of Icerya purchasi]|uniref:hypothetical protein n=1 Tax=Candidatus Walczuchella endosymbiont of Icerya purchasi TaxID=3066219 RepID=UPI00313EAB1D
MTKKLIGPALYGVTNKRNSEWIKNNKDLIKSGDKDAISIYKEYGKIDMNPFPQLYDTDIILLKKLLKYNHKILVKP